MTTEASDGAVERVARYLNARSFMGVETDFIDDQATGASDGDPVVDLMESDLRTLLSQLDAYKAEIERLREGRNNLSSASAFVFNRLTNGRPATRLELTERLRGPIDRAQALLSNPQGASK